MSRIPDGGCIIGALDLVDAPYTCQLTYHILRTLGAPIIGEAVLLLDPSYKWFVDRDNDDDSRMVYEWEYVG